MENLCPSCSAPAESRQRWCLECGHELPHRRHPGLRPAVGIATTLTVLVGAASAGAYTLMADKQPAPPPATTVAQAPPPPAATTPTVPPATEGTPTMPSTPPSSIPRLPSTRTPAVPATPPSNPTPATPPPSTSSGSTGTGTGSTGTGSTGTGSTGNSGSTGTGSTGDSGSGTNGNSGKGTGTTRTTPTTPKPELTDIALGAVAIPYAPYADPDADLGDPSTVNDGMPKTAWSIPAVPAGDTDPQVGVYVDLADQESLRKLVIETPTPGMNVEIYAARSGPPAKITDPGWTHLGTRDDIARRTTIGLPAGSKFRYVLVWIVGLPSGSDTGSISELSVLSMQPQ